MGNDPTFVTVNDRSETPESKLTHTTCGVTLRPAPGSGGGGGGGQSRIGTIALTTNVDSTPTGLSGVMVEGSTAIYVPESPITPSLPLPDGPDAVNSMLRDSPASSVPRKPPLSNVMLVSTARSVRRTSLIRRRLDTS